MHRRQRNRFDSHPSQNGRFIKHNHMPVRFLLLIYCTFFFFFNFSCKVKYLKKIFLQRTKCVFFIFSFGKFSILNIFLLTKYPMIFLTHKTRPSIILLSVLNPKSINRFSQKSIILTLTFILSKS